MHNKIKVDKFDNNTEFAKLTLNSGVYTLQSIYAASYVFLDKAYILLDKGKNKYIEVYLFAKNGQDLKILSLEFYNELMNYSHYFSRVENNSAAIRSIMQRVLFSVNPRFEESEEQEIQDLLKELEKEDSSKQDKNHGPATSKKKK